MKTIRTFAEAEQVFAELMAGYAPRPQQQRLATAVEQVFAYEPAADEPPIKLLGQAGCGTGKSIAAVTPGVLSGKRIIVATATKALQEQYAGKDLPFLSNALGGFTWALLKGRINYVCRAKMAEVTESDIPNMEALVTELDDMDHSGDFEHLKTEVPEDKRYLLSMSSGECPGKSECPFGQVCFAEKAKEEARDAQVVITNTAMLVTDLRIQRDTDGLVRMLGSYDAVIIDEAHELPEIAANAMADQLRRRGIEMLLTQVQRFIDEQEGDDISKPMDKAASAIGRMWMHLDTLCRDEQVVIRPSEITSNVEPYRDLVEALKALSDIVHDTQIRYGRPQTEDARRLRLGRRLIGTIQKLTEFLFPKDTIVRWAETEKSGRRQEPVTVLKWSPIEVGPFLNETLWSKVPVVLVSATLSVGGDFRYISETLGLENPQTLDVGTPFDYSEQARLFVPDKFQPDPQKNNLAWMSYVQSTTRTLIEQAGGGALLLFTSRKAMKAAYDSLSDVLEMSGYTCLMQGEHGSNKEIAARFESDTHSVLFALRSFFTGVDFAGETCRLVIIDKLPFTPPNDIMFAARSEMINRRHNDRWASFNLLAIPTMALILVQGAGRLIRSVNDTGVVAILDPRISSKGYGRKVIASLPPMPLTTDLNEVAGFFSR